MKEHKEKELVTLRQKPTKNGSQSLFLDYYINGIRYKEYLKMYIVPETDRISKLQNIETMKAAKVMKARRVIDIQNGEAKIKPKVKDILFTQFIEDQRAHYADEGKREYSCTIGKILSWLKLYGHARALRLVDKDYILDFFAFARKGIPEKEKKEKKAEVTNGRRMNLVDGLSDATIFTYYATLGTLFNNAVHAGLISHNPLHDMARSEKPKRPEAEREYLTMDEVKKLVATPCGNEQVKNAFLFACFTGLRIGDIEDMTWDQVRETGNGREVATRMNKTKRFVYVPLTDNAAAFLPERADSEKVWDLCSRSEINSNIKRWVKKAGISKHISFHCSRHTYATLLLTYGADLYTVSKLLGHSSIEVTQVYAKIIDKKRVDTANLIPTL